MPIADEVVVNTPNITSYDIIDDSPHEMTSSGDAVSTVYPYIIKSLDLVGGNVIHILSGYSTITTSSTASLDTDSTVQLGRLVIT